MAPHEITHMQPPTGSPLKRRVEEDHRQSYNDSCRPTHAMMQDLKLADSSDEDESMEATDHVLRDEDVATPTDDKPFISPKAKATAKARHAGTETKRRKLGPSWTIANELAHSRVEPSDEPCGGEIEWSDLVFWLGDPNGQVECECSSCVYHRCHGRSAKCLSMSAYQRLSAKIPLVNVPRIEGIN